MKEILILILVVFMIGALNAQEKEKVYLKIIKEKDGKIIDEIDTFYVSEGEGIYYVSGKGLHKHGLDSILGNYKIHSHKDSKFIAISDQDSSCDSIFKKFWHNGESDLDSIAMEHWHFYRDGSHPQIKHGKGLVWIMSDSVKVVHDMHIDDKDGVIILKSRKGDKVEVIKKKLDKSMVWPIDSLGNLSTSGSKNVFTYSGGTGTFDILENEEGKHKIIKEAIIYRDGESEKNIEIIMGNVSAGEKTIEMFFDEDDKVDSTKLVELEEALIGLGENIKIIKYKTDEDKIVIKAEIINETSKVKETKLKKMNLKHGSEKGLFSIDLKLEKKVSTLILVENKNRKTVYSKKLKKYDGSYSGTIDITKEPDGKYILQIIQGDNVVIKKELTK